MLKILLLTVAISASELSYPALEGLYWDCDTTFMQGDLGGQDMMSCLVVTEEFQKHFFDRDTFMQYWKENRETQWNQRGYTEPANNI